MLRSLLAGIVGALALLLPVAAHAEWLEASSAHFTVYSNDSPEKLKAFATDLERFDKLLRFLRSAPDPAISKQNRLTVYVVGDTDDVAKLAKNSFVAGFYSGRASGSVAFVPRTTGWNDEDFGPRPILFHEYAHHFMWSMYPNVAYPQWFSEGFAEFYATVKFQKDGRVAFGAPLNYRAGTILDGNALPIEKLLTADTLKLNPSQREGVYARGWLLMHYMIIGSQPRNGQLVNYIRAISEGKTGLEAAKVFGDLNQLDRELEKYKRGRLLGYSIASEKLPIGEIAIRKLTPGEAATMRVRILSKNGVDEKTAPGVYAAAKRACAPFPTDPGAQMVLAEAAYDAKDYAAAEAAADRAIAADAKREDAYLYKAMARMEIAKAAKDFTKPSWIAIRKLIVTANKMEPEDPEPLILYFQSFVEQGETPPKLAREGMYKAFELAPQDEGLRMTVALIYLDDGDPEMARAMLMPLAYDPHNGEMAEAAAKLIKTIDDKAKAEPKKEEKSPAS